MPFPNPVNKVNFKSIKIILISSECKRAMSSDFVEAPYVINDIIPDVKELNIPSRAQTIILDIGCGHNPKGDVNIDLYPFDRTQCAYSWNPQEVKNFILADGCQAPFRDKMFDKVYSSHVIEHVEVPLNFLKECKRLSRKEIFIKTPSQFDIDRTRTHIYTWNPHTLKMLITKVFSNVETGYTNTGPWLKRGRKLVDWFPFLPAIFSKMGIHKEIYGRAEIADLSAVEKKARSEKPPGLGLLPTVLQVERNQEMCVGGKNLTPRAQEN